MELFQKADGGVLKSARAYPIAYNTAIKAGQVVALTAGLVTLAAQKQTGAILGVALENHSGVADALDPRANGEEIMVCDAPDAIFRCAAPVFEATGGSATTVTTDELGAFSDDDFNGGLLILVEKDASSTNTDPIGTVKRITDYDYDTGTGSDTISTFTVATGGTAGDGDKFALLPPIGFRKGQLDTARAALNLADTASLALKVVGYDPAERKVRLMSNLHALGVED